MRSFNMCVSAGDRTGNDGRRSRIKRSAGLGLLFVTLKGSAGGRERCIHSVALNVGHFGEQLAGGGIKNIQGVASTDTLSVDQVCKNAADAGGGESTLAKR
jgi:hypothetical protein